MYMGFYSSNQYYTHCKTRTICTKGMKSKKLNLIYIYLTLCVNCLCWLSDSPSSIYSLAMVLLSPFSKLDTRLWSRQLHVCTVKTSVFFSIDVLPEHYKFRLLIANINLHHKFRPLIAYSNLHYKFRPLITYINLHYKFRPLIAYINLHYKFRLLIA